VRRAILTHRRDFAAIAVLLALAIATVGYILAHQPAFTFGANYYRVNAVFADAAAVTAGQGQSITIAGVEVGLVGGVKLEHGRAVVRMEIDRRYAPIYRNATVLLRPRTPLKDMYLALDPGTPSAGRIPAGGTIPLANTEGDVDVDQILGSLDADTRTYLLLLLAGGSQAFAGRGAEGGVASPAAVAALRADLKRFGPLDQSTRAFAKALAARNGSLRRAIHNLNLVAGSLGGVDSQLASLVRASNQNFAAIAAEDRALEAGLAKAPAALHQTASTLTGVQAFAAQSGQALQKLAPFAHELKPALAALQPLARDTTPAIEHQLRPFARDPGVRALASTLAPAAGKLSTAVPALSHSAAVLNRLFNLLAYRRPGGPPSYLYWGAWLAHNANSLVSLQDADGAIVQGQVLTTCGSLGLVQSLEESNKALAAVLGLVNLPSSAEVCGR
jgi:phospholipid/cholesterol/gamma-HCH transport system substrate-binding protein